MHLHFPANTVISRIIMEVCELYQATNLDLHIEIRLIEFSLLGDQFHRIHSINQSEFLLKLLFTTNVWSVSFVWTKSISTPF